MFPEVALLRHASRELVRELGFLDGSHSACGLSHAQCHALIEVEAHGATSQVDLTARLRLDKSRTSRVVDELATMGLVTRERGDGDGRTRMVALTRKGKAKATEVHREASARVDGALALLSEAARKTVLDGMSLYARALEQSRRRSEYVMRPIRRGDNAEVARLVRAVMPEFGASGAGFSILDPEVDDMFAAYPGPRAAYWVVVRRDTGAVAGGGGFAPLNGGDARTCELRKMYTYPDLRGLGFGQALLDECLRGASAAGFRRMYLESLPAMTRARALYERNGFAKLAGPLGSTGHTGCTSFYAKDLPSPPKPVTTPR